MAPDLALACPRCGAALRPGAPWCTQCFHALRPVPTAPAAPVRGPPPEPVGRGEGQDGPPPDPGDGHWPCVTCGTANALTEAACRECGAGFLDGVHGGAQPLLALPVVGDLVRLTGAQRLGLAAAVVVLVMLVTALLGLLTG